MGYKKIIHVDPDACTGCKMCEMVCSLVHDDNAINPKRSRIRIIEDPDKGIYIPKVCNLCEDPACIEACPESALSRDPETKAIINDKESCTGCGLCVDACDYGAITIDPVDYVANVCDLCRGRPKCVEYCLQEALVYKTPQEHASSRDKKETGKER